MNTEDLDESQIHNILAEFLVGSVLEPTATTLIKPYRIILDKHFCYTTEVGKPCSICHEEFNLTDSLSTIKSCNHTFHFKCIEKWSRYKRTCPLCRTNISFKER